MDDILIMDLGSVPSEEVRLGYNLLCFSGCLVPSQTVFGSIGQEYSGS